MGKGMAAIMAAIIKKQDIYLMNEYTLMCYDTMCKSTKL